MRHLMPFWISVIFVIFDVGVLRALCLILILFPPYSTGSVGGKGAAQPGFLFLLCFPCSANHEQDYWLSYQVYFELAADTLNVLIVVVVVVFFTLTDRAATIPRNTRGCQSGTWSAGQKNFLAQADVKNPARCHKVETHHPEGKKVRRTTLYKQKRQWYRILGKSDIFKETRNKQK